MAAALAVAILAPGSAATAAEPLCDWLSGIGDAAQAQARGDLGAAEVAARRALSARPRGPAAARASAALGLALARRDPTSAADALEVALGGAPVPGRIQLTAARGEALLASGDAPAAARLLSDAARSGDVAAAGRARLREARALLAAGLAAEAVSALEALLRDAPDGPDAPPARLALAAALAKVGDRDAAAATYRALWLEFPELGEARAAAETLAAWRASGVPVPPTTADEHLARAERLLASGRPDEALAELDAAARAEEPATDPRRATLLRAGSLVVLGRHAEAEPLAVEAAGAEAPEVRRGARLVLARTAARAGRLDQATRWFREVAAMDAPIPGLPEWRQRDVGDEAAFLAAWLHYDAGDFTAAVPLLEAFARENPRSRRADDARWFAAWSLQRAGRLADADRALARLARGPLADAALYWRARLSRAPARQRKLYRDALAAARGEGWYALLARARLATLGETPRRPAPPEPRPIPDVLDPGAAGRLSIAVELFSLGLRDDALAELRDLARTGRARQAAAAVAQLATFAGDAELPFRMARDHLLPTRRALRWGHPEPLGDVLRPCAEAVGVDPSLVHSVMRRESSFRVDVRSGAGAVGLLQLRPATADRVASLLALPPGAGGRLAEPEVNVSIGTHYLALLLDRFGDPAVALAAYNAGPRAAAEWAIGRAGMPLDAWVESIPYRETRQYVKIVASEWDVYRTLAGGAPPPVDPARPVRAPPPGVAF